jgi:DNA-directed RNA polymerase subunit K/omega
MDETENIMDENETIFLDDDDINEEQIIIDNPEDLYSFNTNYEENKKKFITSPYLNKYEKTKIISERAQQLANGSICLLKNPESYSSVFEIALEELKQKKIPFIIKRPISNSFEYWKIEDLSIL